MQIISPSLGKGEKVKLHVVLLKRWPWEMIVHELCETKIYPTILTHFLPHPIFLPAATELQVKEAGNPQYPFHSSLGSLVGKQEAISVSLR